MQIFSSTIVATRNFWAQIYTAIRLLYYLLNTVKNRTNIKISFTPKKKRQSQIINTVYYIGTIWVRQEFIGTPQHLAKHYKSPQFELSNLNEAFMVEICNALGVPPTSIVALQNKININKVFKRKINIRRKHYM